MALGLSSCGLFVDGNFCTRNLELLSEKQSLVYYLACFYNFFHI